jgi:hypothetical protein
VKEKRVPRHIGAHSPECYGDPSPSERDRYIERAAKRIYGASGDGDGVWTTEAEPRRAYYLGVAERILSELLDENARLRDELREIADCPKRGVKAESTDGQAWNDRAWVIERARAALSPWGGAERPEESCPVCEGVTLVEKMGPAGVPHVHPCPACFRATGGGDVSDFLGGRECVTHHYACDCRERRFKELEAELARERERADRLEAGLLVRQEERDESEAARARLEEAVEALLREFDAEEDEHGFPFNLALRRAHRELVAALSASRGGKP